MPASRQSSGFTLVELMVTVAVFVTLVMLAVPSFTDFRKRSAIRGATEEALGFWNQARFDAARLNQPIKFGLVTSGSNFCLGAAPATTAELTAVAAGTAITPCDCFTTTACTVGRFPADATASSQAEWRGVTVAASPSLGVGTSGVTVIEPKKTALFASGDEGNISFVSPTGRWNYKVNLHIDRFGRGMLCESTSATDQLTEYANRRCAD
jgi:prepilin-type N-terminal cleavage/methylation domain-containing protein